MDLQLKDKFGLHDCRTTHADYANDYLTFAFNDGIYCFEGNDCKRTCKAQMKCHIIDKDLGGVTVYIYTTDANGVTVREDHSETFIEEINKGLYEFEIVTEYKAFNKILLKGYVWFDDAPYNRECEIELLTDDVSFMCLM